jgi:hypothetical protein
MARSAGIRQDYGMRCSRQIVGLCVAVAFSPLAGWAADVSIATSVRNLASPDFAIRQQATSELQQAADEAIPSLVAVVQTGDAEVRRRALGLLAMHALGRDQGRREAARNALRALIASGNDAGAIAAAGTLARIRETTSAAAAAELNRLGATVMPLNGAPLSFKVQIPEKWTGGDSGNGRLA